MWCALRAPSPPCWALCGVLPSQIVCCACHCSLPSLPNWVFRVPTSHIHLPRMPLSFPSVRGSVRMPTSHISLSVHPCSFSSLRGSLQAQPSHSACWHGTMPPPLFWLGVARHTFAFVQACLPWTFLPRPPTGLFLNALEHAADCVLCQMLCKLGCCYHSSPAVPFSYMMSTLDSLLGVPWVHPSFSCIPLHSLRGTLSGCFHRAFVTFF